MHRKHGGCRHVWPQVSLVGEGEGEGEDDDDQVQGGDAGEEDLGGAEGFRVAVGGAPAAQVHVDQDVAAGNPERRVAASRPRRDPSRRRS